MNSSESVSKMPPRRSAQAQSTAVDRIGEQLRDSFRDILEEPVPDRFAALLDELEKSEEKAPEDSNKSEGDE